MICGYGHPLASLDITVAPYGFEFNSSNLPIPLNGRLHTSTVSNGSYSKQHIGSSVCTMQWVLLARPCQTCAERLSTRPGEELP